MLFPGGLFKQSLAHPLHTHGWRVLSSARKGIKMEKLGLFVTRTSVTPSSFFYLPNLNQHAAPAQHSSSLGLKGLLPSSCFRGKVASPWMHSWLGLPNLCISGCGRFLGDLGTFRCCFPVSIPSWNCESVLCLCCMERQQGSTSLFGPQR